MFHSSTPEFVTNRILPPKWEKCTFLQSWFFKYPFNFDFGKKIARFPRNSIRITRFFQTRFNVLPTFQGTGSSVVPECTKLTWLELQQFFPKLSNKKIIIKKNKKQLCKFATTSTFVSELQPQFPMRSILKLSTRTKLSIKIYLHYTSFRQEFSKKKRNL